jgi:alpha-glucosidase (family GH31 glycosyl hydrolase)
MKTVFFVLFIAIMYVGCGKNSTVNVENKFPDDPEDYYDNEIVDKVEYSDEHNDEDNDGNDDTIIDEDFYDPLVDGFFIDDFIIRYAPSPLKITIFHKSNPAHSVFSTAEGFPFVGAKLTTTVFHENAGSFSIEEDVLKNCSSHDIGSFDYDGETLSFNGQFLEEQCDVGFKITFSGESLRRLKFTLELLPDEKVEIPFTLWRAALIYESKPEEFFFGFGEQFTHFNLKGKRLPVLSEEQGIGRGQEPISTIMENLEAGTSGHWYSSYAPVPHYITNTAKSLFLENYEYSIFDFEDPFKAVVEVDSSKMTGQILFGTSFLDLIETYTEYSGRMKPLPDWMGKGAIIGMQGGSSSVRAVHEKMKTHNVPIAGYWLQDWVGKRETLIASRLWWNWELDRKSYPDWEDMIEELDEEGIKVLSYINPFLVDVTKKPDHQFNMFQYATEKGYILKDFTGKNIMIKMGGFDAAMVDLSNPEAFYWMKDIIKKNIIGSGVSGWMADFGESVPYNVIPHSLESGNTFHNRYVELWAQLNREVIEENDLGGEVVFFNRSGFTKSPTHSTLFWLGDQTVTWDKHDGIKTALTGLISSGLSGYSLNHSDIGGYLAVDVPLMKIKRSKELLLRWMEFNAFTAVFRSHEGSNPDSSHQIYSDGETTAFFGKFAKIYALLHDYRKELMEEAYLKGYPLVRHPILHYENDPEVYHIEYQFMLGDQFMIAPVLDEEKTKMTLYLPKGEWIHLWSGETFGNENKGEFITVNSPLGEPPVFYKSDSQHGEKLSEAVK